MLACMTVGFAFDFERALAAMVYLASKRPPNLDKYKLCKLIFLADKYHLVRFSRPITGDHFCAMEYGPVPSNVLSLLDDFLEEKWDEEHVARMREYLEADTSYKYPHFQFRQNGFDFDQDLSISDRQALDEVLRRHGEKSFEELKGLTHEMPAYKEAWENPERSSKNPKMRFESLFLEDGDAIRGADEEMIENEHLKRAFGPDVEF
jgi:uncharacterized phage-associated protein